MNIWKTFPRNMYLSYFTKKTGKTSEAEEGWYCYYLNELVHYSLEAIFWALLQEMENKEYTVEQFVAFITEMTAQYQKEHFPRLSGSISSIIYSSDQEYEPLKLIDEIHLIVKTKNSFRCILTGLLALLCLYRDNKEYNEIVANYTTRHYISDKHGNAFDIFKDYIKRNIE
ncbi:MAG: hypothetical protein IPL20_00140 [Saprospiraceae bacterium]|nr:hypothetical protein [Saprospiraceae bacterium]